MESILEQIYSGGLNLDEKFVPRDPRYREASRKISEALQQWEEQHGPEEGQALEHLLDLLQETHDLELASSFIVGFRLGAGLMVEVLTGPNELSQKLNVIPDPSSFPDDATKSAG